MAKILKEGCVATCGHCMSQISFDPSEVKHSTITIPAGYSPEEEAYDKSVFSVMCPKCHNAVNVDGIIGPLAKKAIADDQPNNGIDRYISDDT